MRKFLVLIAFVLIAVPLASAQKSVFPDKPTAWVNDYAGLLKPEEASALNSKLGYYQDSTSTQIFIVTLDEHGDEPISMLSAEIGQKWGVGQKGKDNGLLILIYPADHEIWISTGYGLEEYLTDAINKRIIENEIKPAFKAGEYYQGLDKATTVMMNILSGVFAGDQYMKRSNKGGGSVAGIIFLIFLFMIIFGAGKGGNSKSVGKNLPLWLALGMLSSTRHSHSGSFGGFSSGGGGFGGFSGGGGGSFGGGGAGGSW
ncbi:MAG: TPM domain-containing protein [Bacteroidales bacterium]|nr:TPM domain-containing protein [Bacteroidales bacterium]MCB8999769.1 TPM domain-containing protein [Bacteroidales bacterium]MCB9013420.1 TPM domain-containing protein [Bacteroidales bacterium]